MNKRILILGGGILVVVFLFMVFLGKGSEMDKIEPADPGMKVLYEKAVALKQNRDMVQAKRVYQEIVKRHTGADNIAMIQKELEDLNLDIIFSNTPIENKSVLHEVVRGNTLGQIAKKYGTTIELIKRSNNLKSDIIRIGQRLRIWQGHFHIFVDKSQNILILKDSEEIVKVYDVATGENNSTPVGEFRIMTKLVNPVWFNQGVVVPPESPENVLGSRWLGFELPGYGIHGTTDPNSIGRQLTAGCVRMLNKDVEEIYSLVPHGTEVVVVD